MHFIGSINSFLLLKKPFFLIPKTLRNNIMIIIIIILIKKSVKFYFSKTTIMCEIIYTKKKEIQPKMQILTARAYNKFSAILHKVGQFFMYKFEKKN